MVCHPILLQAVMGNPLADPEIAGISYQEIVKLKAIFKLDIFLKMNHCIEIKKKII